MVKLMYRYDRKMIKFKKIFMSILLFLSISIGSIAVYEIYTTNMNIYNANNQVSSDIKKVSQDIEISKESTEKEVTQVVEEALQTVVGISKIKNNGTAIFGTNSVEQLGLGTGTIISENGYILTNEHVSGAKYSSCYVTLENGNVYNGNVVWADSDLDVAIIKINMQGLKSITLGNSDSIKIAQKVYAIGNPIGVEFQRTVTGGIISGIDRTIKMEENNKKIYMEDLIQTDATINPGNSGGPLINENGEMLAINSVKITSAEGIGFSIPINIIKPVIEKVISDEKFEEATLGIFAYDREVIPYLDTGVNFEKGIYIAQIDLSGPAKNSQLKVGDIITKIDNIYVNKMSELRTYIYGKKPNEKVILTILRNNKQMEVEIVLGKK